MFIHDLKGATCNRVKTYLKPSFSALKKLKLFCDDQGLLCVHCRTVNLSADYDTRYPILLPKRHKLVEMLIRKIHVDSNHFGWSFMLSMLRQHFWVIQGQILCDIMCSLKNV